MKISIDNTSPLVSSEDTSVMLAEAFKNRGHQVKIHLGNEPFYTRIKSFPCDYYFTDISVIDNDMLHYLSNNYTKTLFIINIPSSIKDEQVLSLEKFLLDNKVKYKLIEDSNFANNKLSVVRKKENLINITYGHTGYLLNCKDVTWKRNIQTLFICNGHNFDVSDTNNFVDLAGAGETFHILNTKMPNATAGLENMRNSLLYYKNILCNYNAFCFWKLQEAPMGRSAYELFRLKKPIYVYEPSDAKYIQKPLKTTQDISWSNRKNVDFNTICETVESDLTFDKQVNKLLSHLPKIKQ